MFHRPLKLLRKFAVWTAASLLVLTLAAVAYVGYVVTSFDTVTLPQRYGQVDAKLFAPAGAPRPLIVGLGGAEGGNGWLHPRWEKQRQRFEHAGYAFLAVGYFGLPNTPEKLDRIALEGVHQAIVKAQSDAAVSDACVIVLGGSKGAELALTLAANFSDIDAVIALAPGDTVFPAHTDAMNTSSWALNREPLPFAHMPWAATFDLLKGDLLAVMQRILADESAAAAAIAVERINGPILLIAADQDEMWPAQTMSERLMKRLTEHDFGHVHELSVVQGDHASPIDHFDRVEAFLQDTVAKQPGCATPVDTNAATPP
ncbi:MAG: acyl-CoA thioester hydrolase/BAAT C-terminal domain-containing protein [Pseudomarimonas sp.]